MLFGCLYLSTGPFGNHQTLDLSKLIASNEEYTVTPPQLVLIKVLDIKIASLNKGVKYEKIYFFSNNGGAIFN